MTNKERYKLKEFFIQCVLKHKNSMQYIKNEKSKIKRFFYNFKKFGVYYVMYNLSRFKIHSIWNISAKLFFGRKMIWPSSDMGANVLLMYRISPHKSEKKLTVWMMDNLEDSEVFYDIGAHLGFYTALSQEILKNGEIHAFEANKKLCKYLNKNFSHSVNVNIMCTAVANLDGDVDFYDATKTEDSSTSSRFNLSAMHINPYKVKAITLDEYVARGNKVPTTIKIDVEGGEYDVIIGASGIIEKYKPKIVMEVWGGEIGREYSDKAIKKLFGFGYEAFALDGSVPITDPVGSILDSSDGARDNFLFLAK